MTSKLKLHSCLLAALVVMSAILLIACSSEDERRVADDWPALAPTTRATETIQRAIDPIATATARDATVIQHAASDAADLGVPGASVVALLAGVVGTIAGVYNERRRGTLPLRSAVTQIVDSVDAAFPKRTDQQKTAMSSVQDQSTKRLVSVAKGEST